jgi:hypothetical protein
MGVSPFHPTIGSEAFILSTLATPVPSHDITRELLQFLRKSCNLLPQTLSLSQSSVRFIRCSLSIKLTIFCSGHVFYKFSEIFLLFSPVTKTTYQASSSSSHLRASRALLFLSAYLGRTFPPMGLSPSCLPSCVFLHTFFLLRKVLDLSCSFCQKETRSVWACRKNCTLWYFGLTVFCLLSQTLHASIHGGS